MSATEATRSEEYLRGWRDGYAAGRDDEARGVDVREGPEPPRRQQGVPRDRQIRHPGRDR
ncbi:hypothetical protein ACKI10_43330 [Streptomyces galilaeus]|uniref:Uncharacterized protein n=1 Tax=Streptomyces galilaeus TaxID=33899 RepID=A0ABW9IYK1_STRGJ